MAGFSRADRQRIIDEYLALTGRNSLHPGEFVDWMADHPEHEAYHLFYGMDDATAAREHRIGLVRQMVSGLRLTAIVQVHDTQSAPVRVAVKEFPSMISPVSGRKSGGGYQSFDPSDPQMSSELRRQGAQALRSWLERYRGVCEQGGIDVRQIEEIAAQLSGGVVAAA